MACRVVERQDVWGETLYRVWLPTKDAVVRARSQDLAALDSIQPTVEHILHTAAAAKLLDALEDKLLLAPIQSSVVPLPHQLYALNRAMSQHRIRYLLADEVGLGKTIEAGLILRELKLRGMVRRVLVVAPKGLVRQWQAEMRLHFGEKLQFVDPAELATFRQWRNDEENLWRLHDQVICSLDSVKPIEGRKGWGLGQLNNYNRERFEDLISASWDLVIIDESHRMGGSTDQVARYKIVLLVFDGLAVDQWVQIREALAKRAPKIGFEESACFAWLPTLTSVSRQALFSGLNPRVFADTIESTSPEPTQWSRFWQDQGLRANEVMYRKGIKRADQLAELAAAISAPSIRVAGMVVDTVDEIVHGAVLGKRGIATQVESWCESGFVDQLFSLLLDKGFHVYLTADHGNVEAVGQGRPNQGVAPELRGERVRTYRNETLVSESAAANPNTYRLDVAGLPANFMTLFAGGRAAFMQQGEPAVVHGGISVEELLVPFVKISYVS